MKKQVTFEKKGLNVIKDLEKYLERNPEDEKYLRGLVEYLNKECLDTRRYENSSLNWFFAIIDQRDEIAHLSKAEHFVFQVNNIAGKIDIYPPNFSHDQTMKESFKIA